jgi:hypothetical protein
MVQLEMGEENTRSGKSPIVQLEMGKESTDSG